MKDLARMIAGVALVAGTPLAAQTQDA